MVEAVISGPWASNPGPAAAGWFSALLEAPAGAGFAPGEGELLLEIAAPEGYELSKGTPWSAAVEVSRRSDLINVTPEFAKGQMRGGEREAGHRERGSRSGGSGQKRTAGDHARATSGNMRSGQVF